MSVRLEFRLSAGLLLLLLTTLLSFSMIIFFMMKAKKTKVFASFLSCQVLIFIWSLGQLLEVLTKANKVYWIFVVVQTFSISFISLMWFVFLIQFTNGEKLLNKKNLFLLSLPPVISFITLLTNPLHKMFYKDFGPQGFQFGVFFWMHFLFCYTYHFIGNFLLIKFSISHPGKERKQTLYFVASVVIPIAANIAHVFGVFKTDVDITPASLTFSLLLFAVATFKHKFLDIMPQALMKMVDNLSEQIVLMDSYGYIVKCNQSFIRTFDFCNINHSKELVENFKKILKDNERNQEIMNAIEWGQDRDVCGEITVCCPKVTYYYVNVHTVHDQRKKKLGRIVSFNDITNYKNLLNELEIRNEKLEEANTYLKDYSIAVGKLAVAEERERISRDVHDSLGQTMTLLIKLHEAALIMLRGNPDKAEELIIKANRFTKEGFRELKRLIMGIAKGKMQTDGLEESLNSIIEKLKHSGMHVDLCIEADLSGLEEVEKETIFCICREALTNSMRHGKAAKVNIFIRMAGGILKLFIVDNGVGCQEVKKGFGLTSMEERVKDLSGNIEYGSSEGSGFNIHVEIPVGRGEVCDQDLAG